MKKIVLTILILVLVEAIGWTGFVYSGVYNVSTANHDNRFVNWWLDTGATRSIKAHAAGIQAPNLDDPARVQEGFRHYDEMCVECHGAPGKPPEDIAGGLWPQAPDLSKTIGDWKPAEVFWIIKNGIKFSAMPGWGPSHDDAKIWAMTAFCEKLPKLSPEDYHRMETNAVKAATPGERHEGNSH